MENNEKYQMFRVNQTAGVIRTRQSSGPCGGRFHPLQELSELPERSERSERSESLCRLPSLAAVFGSESMDSICSVSGEGENMHDSGFIVEA